MRWAKPEAIGPIGRMPIGRDRKGNPRTHTLPAWTDEVLSAALKALPEAYRRP
ncbi:hypothetical protein GCM10011504_26670 [Siccirubricoccus deserti]|nr:hypothetical protein GCM10011504_26670 [Siccirubricoccus deserti]